MIVADTGLVATNARTDVLSVTGNGFIWHLGIGNECPSHTAHISLTRRQYLFSYLWLIDAAGDKNWFITN